MKNMCFFIKNPVDNRCYCSVCGSAILQDGWNTKIHASKCSPKDTFYLEHLREDRDMFYLLEAERGTLSFKIVTPSLRLRPGFHNKYSGGFWKTVFEIALHENTREVEAIYGSVESLYAWVWAIDQKKIKPCHTDSDVDIIHKAFPAIQDIYSFRMLFYLYQTRGFISDPIVGVKSEEDLFSLPVQKSSDGFLFIDTKLHHIQDELVLELLICTPNHGVIRGLVSKNYAYTDKPFYCSENFYKRTYAGEHAEQDIMEFSEKYPEYGLASFWNNGGRNILLPLFSGSYHKGIELLAKAGCVDAARKAWRYELDVDPDFYHNLRELFDVPVSIIRKLGDNIGYLTGNRILINKILEEKRRFLDLPTYTDPMLDCLFHNLSVKDEHLCYSEWFESLGDDQIFRILKYLCSDKVSDYSMYRDYIRACHELGQYIFGLTPKNIRQAHDDVWKMVEDLTNRLQEKHFQSHVESAEYQKLTTGYSDQEACFVEDPYIIIAPSGPQDLIKESAAMNHCVRLYISDVARGSCQILFLRRKSDPDISFGTIEVAGGRLMQAKAQCNRKLPMAAQRFLCKWADIKGIEIRSRDITSQAIMHTKKAS